MDGPREAYEAWQRFGSKREAARQLGIPETTLKSRILRYDPAIGKAQEAVGTNLVPQLAWFKTTDADGNGYSVLLKPAQGDAVDFKEAVSEAIQAALKPLPKHLPSRFKEGDGSLLVLDPADVHIGKLCVATETGYEYNPTIAEHRLVEGCRLLMSDGKRDGVSAVLLVIGNDIAHIDNAKKTTTSGTPQDVSGSVFEMLRVAQGAYIRVVQIALDMGLSVRLVFCPSNHDWVLGWTVAQTVAAYYHADPNVEASEYAISERHRKYVRFGKNLIMFSHGDGAKDGDLPQIMLREARPHIADCPHLYAYLHHYHHKMKKHLGIRPTLREKDHIAMTVMRAGSGEMEGDNVKVEHVRSPSPPDSWHDRQGYINRQAVEAFIHCPERGQVKRLTEWF